MTLSGTAARLIARYGAAMVLSQTEAPGYDPATGSVTGMPVQHEVTGLVERMETAFSGGAVPRGDLLVTLSGEELAGTQPKPGDRLRVAGHWHDVVEVSAIGASGSGEPLLFRLLVRR